MEIEVPLPLGGSRATAGLRSPIEQLRKGQHGPAASLASAPPPIRPAGHRGLRVGQMLVVSTDDSGLLVKPEIARRQLEAESVTPAAGAAASPGATGSAGGTGAATVGRGASAGGTTPVPISRRYYGSCTVGAIAVNIPKKVKQLTSPA